MADNITSFGESYFNKKATFFNGLDSEEIKSGKITVGGKNNFISGVSTFSANSISVDDGYLNSLKVSGVSTFSGNIDGNANLDISGTAKFTNATQNTLGNVNTGAIQIDGGVGIEKNVSIGHSLEVGGGIVQNGNKIRAFQSYAVLRDVKGTTTDGGSSSTTTWHQRTLNTETDPDSIVTLSSNQFTLSAGSYLIQWSTCGYRTRRFASVLFDTNNNLNYPGLSIYLDDQDSAGNSIGAGGVSTGSARVTMTSNTTYRILAYSELAVGTTGLGIAHDNSYNNVYTEVTIFKEMEVY